MAAVGSIRDEDLDPSVPDASHGRLRGNDRIMVTATDESALIAALRAGDQNAFAALVDEHTPAMLRVAGGHVPSHAIAEEVVQETWIALVRGIDRFEGRSSLKTWLFTVMSNIAKARGVRERRDREAVIAAATVDPARFHGPAEPGAGGWKEPPVAFPAGPEGSVLGDELRAVPSVNSTSCPSGSEPWSPSATCSSSIPPKCANCSTSPSPINGSSCTAGVRPSAKSSRSTCGRGGDMTRTDPPGEGRPSSPRSPRRPAGPWLPAPLWRALENHPPPGLSRIRWRSPLRGPWLTSVFGAMLLVVLPIVIVTGLLSYIAYGPQFRAGHSRRRRLAQTSHLRLAERPVVAVPADPGPARRSWA